DKNKAILEGIADGVVLADSEGKIILFNSAAERILRVPRTEASGKKLSTITGVYGPSAQSWAQALETRMIDPESSEIGEFIDERVALGDRTVSVHLSPVYTGDRYLGTVSVFRDITREVEAERSKSEFVANVSHEFRTPLTSIKGYNDLLLMGAFGEVGDQQKRMLSTIKDNVTRLAALVEDVLNISQIDSGKERLAVEKVDLNELMQHVIDHIRQRPQHQFKDLSIEFDPMPGLPVIEADPEKLMRAFGNVIDNAFNYTLAGGTISIDIAPDDGEQILHIAISDTGVGIPDEFAERIWRRFERHEDTALSLDVAGTGLGLPIVKELVEMHGGEIWFESEVGVGTTFYIKLPFKQPMSMYGDTMVNPGD
ncbi:MAG: sensor histidine kinase, partial [Chloroflexota bacterium]